MDATLISLGGSLVYLPRPRCNTSFDTDCLKCWNKMLTVIVHFSALRLARQERYGGLHSGLTNEAVENEITGPSLIGKNLIGYCRSSYNYKFH